MCAPPGQALTLTVHRGGIKTQSLFCFKSLNEDGPVPFCLRFVTAAISIGGGCSFQVFFFVPAVGYILFILMSKGAFVVRGLSISIRLKPSLVSHYSTNNPYMMNKTSSALPLLVHACCFWAITILCIQGH